MSDLEAISEALKLVGSKIQSLEKAFEDLQGHSHLLDSFSLSWSDLESHFTSIHSSLAQRFLELEPLQPPQDENRNESNSPRPELKRLCEEMDGKAESNSPRPELKRLCEEMDGKGELNSPQPELTRDQMDGKGESNSPRPELKRLCEEMDGKGLSKYVSHSPRDRESIRNELPAALKCAPDQESLVLDAVDGFYSGSSTKPENLTLSSVRRGCVLLLETLMDSCPNVGDHVTERAKKLALVWKRSLGTDKRDPLDALGFLHLVAAYKLSSEFDVDELVDYFSVVARYQQATKLCKAVGLSDRVADIVQKLLEKGKQLLAAKFIFEFELTDKFPPVPILKDYVKETKKAAKEVCKEGKFSLRAMNEAAAKELGALKSVFKYIEEYKLNSDYPSENLEKRIEELEKQLSNRRRPPDASPLRARHKQPQEAKQRFKKQKFQSKNQRPWQVPINRPRMGMAAPFGSVGVPNILGVRNPTYPPYQRTHLPSAGLIADLAPYQHSLLQPAGSLPNHPVSYAQSHYQPASLLPDHSAPFESSSAMPYGMAVAGSTPAVASYHGSSAEHYGRAVAGSTPAIASYHDSSTEYYGSAGGPMGFPGNATTSNSYLHSSEPYAPPGYGASVPPPPYHPSYYPQ